MRIVLCWLVELCLAASAPFPFAEYPISPSSSHHVNQWMFSRSLNNRNRCKREWTADTHTPFHPLMEMGTGRIAITSGACDANWFPSYPHYPEGLYISGFENQLQSVLGILYDSLMIGTMEPERNTYPHMLYLHVHPCTPYFKRLANIFQWDIPVTKMLFSPFTSLCKRE